MIKFGGIAKGGVEQATDRISGADGDLLGGLNNEAGNRNDGQGRTEEDQGRFLRHAMLDEQGQRDKGQQPVQ